MGLVENYGIDSNPIYMTDTNVSELVMQSHVSYQYSLGYPKVVFWGPYYFYCISINDLPECLEHLSYSYMFADDSKCMHIIQNFYDTIDFQDDFNSVYR